jgi:hypothetical protein
MWKQWLNIVLGFSVAMVSYFMGRSLWNVVLGIVIAVLALWAALERPGI